MALLGQMHAEFLLYFYLFLGFMIIMPSYFLR